MRDIDKFIFFGEIGLEWEKERKRERKRESIFFYLTSNLKTAYKINVIYIDK